MTGVCNLEPDASHFLGSHPLLETGRWGCYFPWWLHFKDGLPGLRKHSCIVNWQKDYLAFEKMYIHFKEADKGLIITKFLK